MQALVWHEDDGRLSHSLDYPVPVPGPGEVLVRVTHCGVCGTDFHIIDSIHTGSDKSLIPGHEISGVIEELGSSQLSEHLQPGDRVFLNPNAACSRCEMCQLGHTNYCLQVSKLNIPLSELNGCSLGVKRNGGWADYVVVKANQVFVLPDSLPNQTAALCEPLSCIAHGIDLIAEPSGFKSGTRALILGAGIIGLLWSVSLKMKGVRHITICEISTDRQRIAKQLCASFVTLSPEEMGNLPGKSFDLIVDCSGSAQALSAALCLAEYRASICVFGVAAPEAKSEINLFDFVEKELRLVGALINPFTSLEGLALADQLNEAGFLNFEKLGVGTMKLDNYRQGFDQLKSRKISKLVFTL